MEPATCRAAERDDRPQPAARRADDETDPGDPFFTINIKLPKSREQCATLIQSISRQATSQKDFLTIKLPIEDRGRGGPNHDQITVSWRSLRKGGEPAMAAKGRPRTAAKRRPR